MKTYMEMVSVKPMDILLIEDNHGDVILVDEALKELNQTVRLNAVESGVKAMDYLRKKEPYLHASRPDLIILDLNLPIKNGFEVLKEIKADEKLKGIPVAVFTTSQSHKDIIKTYGLGGTFFITKPLGFYEFIESVKSIISGLAQAHRENQEVPQKNKEN